MEKKKTKIPDPGVTFQLAETDDKQVRDIISDADERREEKQSREEG